MKGKREYGHRQGYYRRIAKRGGSLNQVAVVDTKWSNRIKRNFKKLTSLAEALVEGRMGEKDALWKMPRFFAQYLEEQQFLLLSDLILLLNPL